MRLEINKLINNYYAFQHDFFEYLKNFFSSKSAKIYIISVFILNALIWFVAYIINFYNVKKEDITLHYNINFGTNLIGSSYQVYIIPITGLLLFIFNMIILYTSRNRDNRKFNQHIILSGSLIVNLFLLISISTIFIFNYY